MRTYRLVGWGANGEVRRKVMWASRQEGQETRKEICIEDLGTWLGKWYREEGGLCWRWSQSRSREKTGMSSAAR